MEAKQAVASSRESTARMEEIQHALDTNEARAASVVKEDGDEIVGVTADATAVQESEEILRLKKVLREERAQHEKMIMASRFVLCVDYSRLQ